MIITDRLTLTPPAEERLAILLIAGVVPILGVANLAALGITALPTAAVAVIMMLIFWYANQAIITGAAFDELDQDVRDIDTAVARAAVEARTIGAPAPELKPDARARVIAAMAEENLGPLRRATTRIYFGAILGIALLLLLTIITPHESVAMHLSWVAVGFLQIVTGALAPTAHAYVHLRDAGEPCLAARVPLNTAVISSGFVMLGMVFIMRHAGPVLAALLG